MTLRRTSLTPYAATMADPDPHGARNLAARAWREHGHFALTADQVRALDWQDRELITAIAVRLYGVRDGP